MIILDTHVWFWWVNGDHQKLRPEWIRLLESDESLFVSAISCFEMAWQIRSGRIELAVSPDEWFENALSGAGIEVLPVTAPIARLSADLPQHHKDPHDRMIIATAITKDARLLSADERFPAYEELKGRLVP